MRQTRSHHRLAAGIVAGALLLGVGVPVAASAKEGDKGQQQAQRSLDDARKGRERSRRNSAIAEAKGSVVTVNATTRTFELQVKEANQAALRNTKVTVQLPANAYLSLNDRTVTLADVKVGDGARVTGLVDGAKLTGYLVRFSRTAPAPVVVKGIVSAVTTSSFTLTVSSAPVTSTLGTPSIVTLNGQPATLADVHVGDKGEATTVSGVAYVARFSRPLPATPGPVKVEGTVSALSPLTLLVKGVSTPITVAVPALVNLNDAAATIADVKVGDRCTATGINGTTLTVFQLSCLRP